MKQNLKTPPRWQLDDINAKGLYRDELTYLCIPSGQSKQRFLCQECDGVNALHCVLYKADLTLDVDQGVPAVGLLQNFNFLVTIVTHLEIQSWMRDKSFFTWSFEYDIFRFVITFFEHKNWLEKVVTRTWKTRHIRVAFCKIDL